MKWRPRTFLFFLLTIQSHLIHSKSIIDTLPGYPGRLPFTLETGYVGIGEKEETQLFYYFVESEGNPDVDPLIFYLTGGPGTSALCSIFHQIGPLNFNFGNALEDTTLKLNPNSWTKMASIIFIDIPVGAGFSYATTKEASISSDSVVAKQANEFLKKEKPCDLGYILCSPLTDKFMDFNSRIEFAHRMALISDEIYESVVDNCAGDYLNTYAASSLCLKGLQRYEKCTRRIEIRIILDPLCDENDLKPFCQDYYNDFIEFWANDKAVQQALNIRTGTIGKWELYNQTLHYLEGKNDTSCYSYDIFSSFAYHKELVSKNCRALIFNGDHDMTFPYNGVEQWIGALNLGVDSSWEPFYVDNQVGGYEMTCAQKSFSLTYATVKGAGHSVALYKPKEAMVLVEKWLNYNNIYIKASSAKFLT